MVLLFQGLRSSKILTTKALLRIHQNHEDQQKFAGEHLSHFQDEKKSTSTKSGTNSKNEHGHDETKAR